MKNLFNMDGPVFTALYKLADIVILNIMFLVGCIPIITIGASLTALYTTSIHCICQDESYVVRTFWKAFASHFKRSTLLYLILLLASVIIYTDLRYGAIIMPASLYLVVSVLTYSVIFILLMLSSYIFAYISVSDTTLKGILKGSLLLSIGALPCTLIVILLNILPIIITLITGNIYSHILAFYFVIGFAAVSSINSIFLIKAFKKFHLMEDLTEL